MTQDVTKLKEAELEKEKAEIDLKRTKKYLELILDHTPMMVAYLDTELNFQKVNEAFAKGQKKVPSFFKGKNLRQFESPFG